MGVGLESTERRSRFRTSGGGAGEGQSGDGRRETRDERQETGDRRQETRDERRETEPGDKVLKPDDGDLFFELFEFAVAGYKSCFVLFGEGGGEAVGDSHHPVSRGGCHPSSGRRGAGVLQP